jgi:pimeloyl-ACP methyl ester carboxylesterase
MGIFKAIRLGSADPAVFPTGVERLDYASGVDGTADWAMVWPGESTERWIVKLHGHGSHGDQLWTRPDLRDQWLPAFRATGASILSPNLRDNAWMGPSAAADLHDLLTFVRSRYSVKEFIFASGSMGGTSNLVYAVLHPEDVAAVVALCAVTDMGPYYDWCRRTTGGPGSLAGIADAIQNGYDSTPAERPDVYQAHSALAHADRLTMPVMLVHGSADEIIPVDESRRLAQRLDGVGTFRYVEMPDGHHDSPLAKCVEALHWVLAR